MNDKQDRNFDSLSERFERKVYATAKGQWRLKLLKEDLHFLQEQSQPLAIWDAGCGFAQISHWFAQRGHAVTLCDVSKTMLYRARQLFEQTGLYADFHHQAAQTLAPTLAPFDVVLCHAVVEWLAEPLPSLETIARLVKPGGYLSLLFYNRNAMIFSNTLRGGWRWHYMLNDSYMGKGSKLTPPNPQYPHDMLAMLQQWGFAVVTHTGIRVFHDYVHEQALLDADEAQLFELEYRHCRAPAFRDLGRYVHLLAQRAEE